MTILTSYLDAGRTSQAVTVAGYVSDAERWEEFERAWSDMLTRFDLPFFHMTDFAARKRDYEHWSAKAQCRLVDLLHIINEHVLAAVAVSIPVALWSALPDEEKARSGNPYYLAAFSCFHEFTRWMRGHRSPDDEIAYVYDQGDEGRGEVLKVFNLVYDDAALRRAHRLLSMKFEDKRRSVPIQAADVLAWEANREAPKRWGLDPEPSRPEFAHLLRAPWHYWGFPNATQLSALVRVFSRVNLRSSMGWNTASPIGPDS